ncbi:MAG: hypothetical protein GWP19_03205, partial [Planctomycetia bacterium]|nr:hypothetical protein [Planctomycetia bacterium]
FLWIFRKQIAYIIHNHTESIQLRHTIKLHKSGLSSFVEALEFIIGDIDKYFMLGSGLSARRAMKEMHDFCGLKLKTLKKLLTEYEQLEETITIYGIENHLGMLNPKGTKFVLNEGKLKRKQDA